MVANSPEIVGSHLLVWVIKFCVALTCLLVFLKLSNVQRGARTIEGIHLSSSEAVVKSFRNYEGTNIIKLESTSGLEIEIWYGDRRSEFAHPPVEMQIKHFGSVSPICREAVDPQLRFPETLNFLPYAKTTKFGSQIYDFQSLMMNLDKAEEFLRFAYGSSEANPKTTIVNGVTYKCFLKPSENP